VGISKRIGKGKRGGGFLGGNSKYPQQVKSANNPTGENKKPGEVGREKNGKKKRRTKGKKKKHGPPSQQAQGEPQDDLKGGTQTSDGNEARQIRDPTNQILEKWAKAWREPMGEGGPKFGWGGQKKRPSLGTKRGGDQKG